MHKLFSILGAVCAAIPLLAHAESELQSPTVTPKTEIKSPETTQKSQQKDKPVTDENTANDDAPTNPIIPPSNNLNDSPGP